MIFKETIRAYTFHDFGISLLSTASGFIAFFGFIFPNVLPRRRFLVVRSTIHDMIDKAELEDQDIRIESDTIKDVEIIDKEREQYIDQKFLLNENTVNIEDNDFDDMYFSFAGGGALLK